MKTTHTLVSILLLAAGDAVAHADPLPSITASSAPAGKLGHAQALGVAPGATRQDAVWAYNTFDCPDCYWGMNIGWVHPGCYVDGGANCPGYLYVLAMNTEAMDLGYQAPTYNDGADSWITDIFFDDYEADLDIWGDPGALQPLVAFTGLAWTFNDYGLGATKTFIFNYLWIDSSGGAVYGQRQWELEVANGDNFLWLITAGEIDMPLDIVDAFEISREGMLCFDYNNETLEGHGDAGAWNTFVGGDLIDPTLPYPTMLYQVGYNDEFHWAAGGFGDPNVDDTWDGEPGASYLDVINTAYLINWSFDSNNGEIPHGHPTQMGIFTEEQCVGDLDGDGDTDNSDLGILLISYDLDDGGDADGDGDTDQSDLGLLLADYGCGL